MFDSSLKIRVHWTARSNKTCPLVITDIKTLDLFYDLNTLVSIKFHIGVIDYTSRFLNHFVTFQAIISEFIDCIWSSISWNQKAVYMHLYRFSYLLKASTIFFPLFSFFFIKYLSLDLFILSRFSVTDFFLFDKLHIWLKKALKQHLFRTCGFFMRTSCLSKESSSYKKWFVLYTYREAKRNRLMQNLAKLHYRICFVLLWIKTFTLLTNISALLSYV